MTLADLWLAILLSAVFVFVVSFVLHMVIPIHKGDFAKLPNEGELLDAMRGRGIQPGDYAFPYAGSVGELGSPETIEKFKQGPVGFLTVVPSGPPAMGKSLLQWFLYSVLVSVFAGYVGTFRLSPGSHYLEVFRLTGTVAVVAYSLGNIPNSIWKGTSWWTTVKYVFDGVIYGLVTAGTFGWLWPSAA